jgi:hypothetical protein
MKAASFSLPVKLTERIPSGASLTDRGEISGCSWSNGQQKSESKNTKTFGNHDASSNRWDGILTKGSLTLLRIEVIMVCDVLITSNSVECTVNGINGGGQ